jgi:hypothetical protein
MAIKNIFLITTGAGTFTVPSVFTSIVGSSNLDALTAEGSGVI